MFIQPGPPAIRCLTRGGFFARGTGRCCRGVGFLADLFRRVPSLSDDHLDDS
jgi:hypothetical protein